MASRLNEFTRFMNDFGPRAFDQLAVGRLGASIAAAAEGIPADVTPLDGLAAHWATLSADEKTRFFRRLAAAAPAQGRRRPKKSARARVAKPAVEPKRERAKNEPKEKDGKGGKKAKKEAKAKAKEEKKLRKKEAKAKEKAEKKAKKLAKAAEKKAKAAQLATTQ